MQYRSFLLLILVCLGLAQASQAYAQQEGLAAITEPDLKNFPTIATFLDVHDFQGNFISGLQPADVTVLENEKPLPISELTEEQPGIRFILAINAGPALGLRDQKGISRYDLMVKSLLEWLGKRQANDHDEYTLLTNNGAQAPSTAGPQELAQALSVYQVDMHLAKPDTQSLSQAIDLASDPAPRVGIGRAILYITPVPGKDALPAISDLAARAQQMGVRIFVWIAAGQDANSSDEMKSLEQLGTVTGGTYFTFSGSETLPDPGVYLEPLGKIYSLAYTSIVNQNGRQSLAVKVTHAGTQINSPARFFTVTVKPPNPMFVSPPTQVKRANRSDSSAQVELWPHTQPLEILVEFPDGHPRPLKATRLFVDGAQVAENTQEPFNNFNLPLDGYTASKQIKLKVEVEDSLGMVGASIETQLQVIVVPLPTTDALKIISHNRPWLAVAAALLAGGVLATVLVLSWRRYQHNGPGKTRHKGKDPLTQPVRVRKEPIRLPHLAWSERLTWPRSHPTPAPALAQLVRLSDQGQPQESGPITITSREVTFGKDPILATCVIDQPGVDGLHTRLRQDDEGNFILYDQGSAAGTWVNYTPISSEGTRLEHGDLVHIGKIGFRFLYASPTRTRQIVITPYQETP